MKRLLIADDEEGVRSLVRITLESDGYEIIEASNGEEALALARRHHPDLMFLDVRMPGIDGTEVCRAIKEDPATSDITVVMLTAQAQDEDRRRGLEVGADDYFTKPFSPTALLDKVQEVFG